MAGAKTYNKPTLLKSFNMVRWATFAEQYRIACRELEARSAAVIKKILHIMN